MNWGTYLGQLVCKSWGIESRAELLQAQNAFLKSIHDSVAQANDNGLTDAKSNSLFYQLRHAFVNNRAEGLQRTLHFLFQTSILDLRNVGDDRAQGTSKQALSDLRHPSEWFPATRAIQRTIHLHIGPTNSGKTYQALQRLEAAKTGIYAGPLRLLAHEVYSRFNAKGKLCALITGEERRIPEGLEVQMSSCTVEMVPLNTRVEVAVIDEIQMMADEERGWAWTQAFLGVQADEVHLCGEVRTESLIREICASIGDKLIVHNYQRLGPLQVQKQSLNGNLQALEKGDAIILFSRLGIHAMKNRVEMETGRRCAVVYGSLPPETRAHQAALFNDQDNDYDYLVASDAIGMGLNLSVKRVIFEATSKHDGVGHRLIRTSEIKQIGGRAGRYKTASDDTKKTDQEPTSPNVGYITALEDFDLPIITKGMKNEAPNITAAGIFPPDRIVHSFASYFPLGTPFSYILLRLISNSFTSSRYFICNLKDQLMIADIIQPYKLTLDARITFVNCPISIRDPGTITVLQELAEAVATNADGHLLALKSIPLKLLDTEIEAHEKGLAGYLMEAEKLHKILTLYLWLSYRFVGIFTSQDLAFHAKTLIEAKIDECLHHVSFTEKQIAAAKKSREKFSAKAAQAELVADGIVPDEKEDNLQDEIRALSKEPNAILIE